MTPYEKKVAGELLEALITHKGIIEVAVKSQPWAYYSRTVVFYALKKYRKYYSITSHKRSKAVRNNS